MNLVDEENATGRNVGDLPYKLVGIGHERGEDGRAPPAEFRGDRPGEARLAKTRRPAQKDMPQRLTATIRSPDGTPEVPHHRLLADEVVQGRFGCRPRPRR